MQNGTIIMKYARYKWNIISQQGKENSYHRVINICWKFYHAWYQYVNTRHCLLPHQVLQSLYGMNNALSKVLCVVIEKPNWFQPTGKFAISHSVSPEWIQWLNNVTKIRLFFSVFSFDHLQHVIFIFIADRMNIVMVVYKGRKCAISCQEP